MTTSDNGWEWRDVPSFTSIPPGLRSTFYKQIEPLVCRYKVHKIFYLRVELVLWHRRKWQNFLCVLFCKGLGLRPVHSKPIVLVPGQSDRVQWGRVRKGLFSTTLSPLSHYQGFPSYMVHPESTSPPETWDSGVEKTWWRRWGLGLQRDEP